MGTYEVVRRINGGWLVEERGLSFELARAEARRVRGFCQPESASERAEVIFDEQAPAIDLGDQIASEMYAIACGR